MASCAGKADDRPAPRPLCAFFARSATLLWRLQPRFSGGASCFFLFAGVQAFSPGFNGFTVNLLSVREGL